MIQAIKNMFSKGACEKCGWLVACPECSERMRQVDSELKMIERSYAHRKEPCYSNKDRSLNGRFDGMVDKGSFLEVLQQVLGEHQGESTGSRMLTVTVATPAIADDPTDWQLVLREVAQRIVSQVRHEDFVTSFDDQTFALLLIDSGEEPLQFTQLIQRIEDQLVRPFTFVDWPVDCLLRPVPLLPGTTREDILRHMNGGADQLAS